MPVCNDKKEHVRRVKGSSLKPKTKSCFSQLLVGGVLSDDNKVIVEKFNRYYANIGAPGADNIAANVLKCVLNFIVNPLTHLCQL